MTPPRNRPGRPPVDKSDPQSVSVHIRLPSKVYDNVYARAQRSRVSIPELIRRRLGDRRDEDEDESD